MDPCIRIVGSVEDGYTIHIKDGLGAYSLDEWTELKSIFNGLIEDIKDFGWTEGERNNMAVDIMITSDQLGMSLAWVNHIMGYLRDGGEINSYDLDDFFNRQNKIKKYLSRWDGNAFVYMLDYDNYSNPTLSWPIKELVFADNLVD